MIRLAPQDTTGSFASHDFQNAGIGKMQDWYGMSFLSNPTRLGNYVILNPQEKQRNYKKRLE
jgi:hypothetical protein